METKFIFLSVDKSTKWFLDWILLSFSDTNLFKCLITKCSYYMNFSKTHEKLEVDEKARKTVDIAGIVKEKSENIVPPLGSKPLCRTKVERPNSEDFVDNPDVPPLEWSCYASCHGIMNLRLRSYLDMSVCCGGKLSHDAVNLQRKNISSQK